MCISPHLRSLENRHAPERRLGEEIRRLAVAGVVELGHLQLYAIVLGSDQDLEGSEVRGVRPQLQSHCLHIKGKGYVENGDDGITTTTVGTYTGLSGRYSEPEPRTLNSHSSSPTVCMMCTSRFGVREGIYAGQERKRDKERARGREGQDRDTAVQSHEKLNHIC